jgi:hypothetical protein
MRLVESIKLRKGGGQMKIYCRIISIGLDRPATPRDRLLPTADVELRLPRYIHPHVGRRIARTEPQGFGNMSFRLFGATDMDLTKSDKGMGASEISI